MPVHVIGRALRAVLIAIALGYIVCLALLMAFEDRLIFFPTRGGRVSGPGVDLELRAKDGVSLHARYIEQPGATQTLLYLHGNAGNLANRSDVLVQLTATGAHVLALDYRGYGQSDGSPSEAGVYLDARAAYDWAVARAPGSSLWLLGESLGGGVACELAAAREVGGLILLSAFTSIADMAALSFPWLPVRLLVRTRFDNLEKLARVRAPVLVIHGRRDELVPFEMGERLFERARQPKRALWLEHAGHNDVFYSEGERVAEAIRELMSSVSSD
jgi:fermentation-respiration switch protein FrsA (DUF1100 family)